jgi:protein SCO1
MKALALFLRGAVGALGLTLCACGQSDAPPSQAASIVAEAALPAGCLIGANDAIGGPISLIDHTGGAVTQENFHEAPTLIYFGFTYCPDICPLTLQAEKATLARLGQQGQVIQTVLITLDPARDTPKQLAAYVSSKAFPDGLLGLTGSPAQIDAAAKAFKVAYSREEDPNSAADYTIAHTSFLYLMDENWRLSAMYPSTLSPDEAAVCLKAAIKTEENPT